LESGWGDFAFARGLVKASRHSLAALARAG
jgi:hypothetical protein